VLALLRDEQTGRVTRSAFYDLKRRVIDSPVFAMTFTVMHTIDRDSRSTEPPRRVQALNAEADRHATGSTKRSRSRCTRAPPTWRMRSCGTTGLSMCSAGPRTAAASSIIGVFMILCPLGRAVDPGIAPAQSEVRMPQALQSPLNGRSRQCAVPYRVLRSGNLPHRARPGGFSGDLAISRAGRRAPRGPAITRQTLSARRPVIVTPARRPDPRDGQPLRPSRQSRLPEARGHTKDGLTCVYHAGATTSPATSKASPSAAGRRQGGMPDSSAPRSTG